MERIQRIEKVASEGKPQFLKSDIYQNAVIRNYEVIGEIVKRLPESLLQTATAVPWADLKGFRDFLSHNYDRVDLEIVWSAIEQLPTLRSAIQTLLDTFPPDAPTNNTP
jgi:uncharacterized protein with HEPN domain